MTHAKTTISFVVIGLAMTPLFVSAGEWGIGTAAGYLQSPHSGVEGRYLAVPYFTYQGERLNIDLSAISYTLSQSKAIRITLEGELRFEGYEANDSPALSGMEKRSPSFDAGVGAASPVLDGEIKVMILGDVTGTHEGYEARAQYQIPYVLDRWVLAPAIGVSWLDKSLVDYYYGVQQGEATPNRPYYLGKSSTNQFVEIGFGYAFSDHLELTGGVKYVRLDKSITASPIVGQEFDASAFSTLLYKF